MKKQTLKSFALNKNKVSNLTEGLLLGGSTSSGASNTGYPTSTALSILGCTLQCGGGTTGPAPSGEGACNKK